MSSIKFIKKGLGVWLPLVSSSGGGGGGSLMLDGITAGIKYAYSTRKLLTSYAGNALQVQRISDNTTQNIGFASGVLDTTSLATFCSGTTGKVITWYDQSGNGFNLTQAVATAPTIYTSGTVQTINSQPAILFVKATPTILQNSSTSGNPSTELYVNVISSGTLASGPMSFVGAATGGTGGSFTFRVDTTGKTQFLTDHVALQASSTGSVTTGVGFLAEFQFTQATGAYQFWINRATSGSGTVTPPTWFAGNLNVGNGISSEAYDGLIGELIAYDVSGGIPSGSQTTITGNQHTYWGTP